MDLAAESNRGKDRQISDTMRGVLWTLGSVAGLAGVVLSVRAVKVDFSVLELLFLRAFVGLIVISAIMAPRHGWRGLITRRPKLQLIRNICHVGAQYGVFYAIVTIPLAVVTSIEYLVPAISAAFAALTIGVDRPRGSVNIGAKSGFADRNVRLKLYDYLPFRHCRPECASRPWPAI